MEVIEACTGRERWWSEATAVFAECMNLQISIGVVEFNHCPREANEAAHEIARECFSTKNSCIWDDDPPRFLLRKILNDVILCDN